MVSGIVSGEIFIWMGFATADERSFALETTRRRSGGDEPRVEWLGWEHLAPLLGPWGAALW